MRADFQQSEAIDPGDRPAAGADLDQVNHGYLDRQAAAFFEAILAVNLELGGRHRPSVFDDTQLGSGSTHVERQQVADFRLLAVVGAGQRPASRPRLEQTQRKATRGLDG